MENSSDEKTLNLINWLHTLIEIIRSSGNPTWGVLVDAVNEKSAIIGFDEVYLSLSAKGGSKLTVEMFPSRKDRSLHFYSTSKTIRNIIAGRVTLDKAIVEGQIFVRSSLNNLLDIYYLVMNILSDSPTKKEYLMLWLDFEKNWRSDKIIETYCLEDQIPSFGIFVNSIPNIVKQI